MEHYQDHDPAPPTEAPGPSPEVLAVKGRVWCTPLQQAHPKQALESFEWKPLPDRNPQQVPKWLPFAGYSGHEREMIDYGNGLRVLAYRFSRGSYGGYLIFGVNEDANLDEMMIFSIDPDTTPVLSFDEVKEKIFAKTREMAEKLQVVLQ